MNAQSIDVDTLEAGPELDALIGERVTYWWGQYQTRSDHDLPVPAYSTDISAAWQVVQAIRDAGLGVIINTMPEWIDRYGWHCRITPEYTDDKRGALATAPTAPLAICRAALKAAVATSTPPV